MNELITMAIKDFFMRLSNYFLWFVAGLFAGYIWMSKAYGLW